MNKTKLKSFLMFSFVPLSGIITPLVAFGATKIHETNNSPIPSPSGDDCPYYVKLSFSSPDSNDMFWIDPMNYYGCWNVQENWLNANWITPTFYSKETNKEVHLAGVCFESSWCSVPNQPAKIPEDFLNSLNNIASSKEVFPRNFNNLLDFGDHYVSSGKPYQTFFQKVVSTGFEEKFHHIGWENSFNMVIHQQFYIPNQNPGGGRGWTIQANLEVPVAPIDKNKELCLHLAVKGGSSPHYAGGHRKTHPEERVLLHSNTYSITAKHHFIEALELGSDWTQIYNHCFDWFAEWPYYWFFAPGNQAEDINTWDQAIGHLKYTNSSVDDIKSWSVNIPYKDWQWDCWNREKLIHKWNYYFNEKTGTIRKIHFDGIEKKVQGYHLQLGNPYAWRTWEYMFHNMWSLRESLHETFDNYPVTVSVNKVNPKGTEASGEPTETYYLTPEDVDSMIDGYKD